MFCDNLHRRGRHPTRGFAFIVEKQPAGSVGLMASLRNLCVLVSLRLVVLESCLTAETPRRRDCAELLRNLRLT